MTSTQLAHYPNLPAARGTETSRQAMRDAQPGAKPLREKILACLAQEPLTTFELAALLAPTPRCTVQPQVSKLKALGRIETSGQRAPTPNGATATRWRLASPTLPAESSRPRALAPDAPAPKRDQRTLARNLPSGRGVYTRIVHALAKQPCHNYGLARALGLRYEWVCMCVAKLRHVRAVEPSGLRDLTPFGKPSVCWQLRDGPYAPDTPAPLLAVLREVLQAKIPHTATPPELALRE